MPDVEVRRDDIRTTRVVEGEARADAVADGDVQLHVERFGISANNVTYAAMGDALRYWTFFPASGEGWGRVPVWGFGDVVASAVEGVAVGERFYGYFPMSSYVTMRPRPGGPGFADVAEHRAELPAVYNQYLRTPPDATHLDETLLLRPLYGTSFLLEDFLRSGGDLGPTTLVLASASSKTAYGLAFLLARASDAPRVVGLTSPGNREFVASLGVYDDVLAYDDAGGLGQGDAPLVFVDMAGDAAVRAGVHEAAGERLQRSVLVGVTHWDAPQVDGDLPGPKPEFFFAPAHLEALTAQIGSAELQRRLGEAWQDLLGQLGDWMEVVHHEGTDALEGLWRAFADGDVDPRRGHVVRLG